MAPWESPEDRPVPVSTFSVGDAVRLVDYEECSDYRDHRGQICTIAVRLVRSDLFHWRVVWADNTSSFVKESNLIRVQPRSQVPYHEPQRARGLRRGDKVELLDYTEQDEHLYYTGQAAVVVRIETASENYYPVHIMWSDGCVQRAQPSNIKLVCPIENVTRNDSYGVHCGDHVWIVGNEAQAGEHLLDQIHVIREIVHDGQEGTYQSEVNDSGCTLYYIEDSDEDVMYLYREDFVTLTWPEVVPPTPKKIPTRAVNNFGDYLFRKGVL